MGYTEQEKIDLIKRAAKIRAALPWGGVNKVVERSGLGRVYVSSILSGKYFNDRVLAIAEEVAKESGGGQLVGGEK
jgi:hypothetical protein